MCPCPAIPITTLGTPRMCHQCPLLRTAHTQTTSTPMPPRQCHACTLPMNDTSLHAVCPGCIVYTLLHQNAFLQRCHDIQDTLLPTPPLKQHHSIHIPTPILVTGRSRHLDGTPIPPTPFNAPPPQQVFDLTLHPYATNKISAVIDRSTAANSAKKHLSHPHMPITIGHLRRLNLTLQPKVTHHLTLRVIYHHMHISARAPLISRDRYLFLTMDNTIHTMTPNATHDPSTRLHYIHLFLNPPTGSPYILYTFDGQPKANPPSLSSDLPSQPVYLFLSCSISDHDDIA